MKVIFSLIGIPLLLFSCDNDSTKPTSNPISTEEEIAIEYSCYN